MTTEKKYMQMKILIIGLLALNVIVNIYIAFLKPGAYSLETLKAGGPDNMRMAKQLYKSDTYVQQQKSTLEQILGSINQGTTTAPAADTTTPTVNTTTTEATAPAVAQ